MFVQPVGLGVCKDAKTSTREVSFYRSREYDNRMILLDLTMATIIKLHYLHGYHAFFLALLTIKFSCA